MTKQLAQYSVPAENSRVIRVFLSSTFRDMEMERSALVKLFKGLQVKAMALDRATQFILQGIRATFGYEYDNREGILLEKVLHNLDMPIQMASYELI